MLSVDHARWGQTPEDLRRLAMSAPHLRTRERFLALHEITRGSCATRVAVRAGRHPQTVMGWLHAYNAQGPDALAYRQGKRMRSTRSTCRRRKPGEGGGTGQMY